MGLFVFGQIGTFAQGSIVAVMPNGRVLEIDLRSASPPAKIPLSSQDPNGFWTSNIDRIKGWTLPQGAIPIQVVNFQAKLVGEKAELRVSDHDFGKMMIL
jgi:hypothetical protein